MVLHLALFVGLAARGDADPPPRPDFRTLIPPVSEAFFPGLRDELDPARQEAVALAEYLNRAWNSETVRNDPDDYALSLLTVVSQLDSALMSINPKPTASQALERVRAYRPVLALVRPEVERAKAEPSPVAPGLVDPLPRAYEQLIRRIKLQYLPLIARSV